MKLWKWLKTWWENTKPVVKNWVFPKIRTQAYPALAQYLNENREEIIRKLQAVKTDEVAKNFCEKIIEVIDRQL